MLFLGLMVGNVNGVFEMMWLIEWFIIIGILGIERVLLRLKIFLNE